MIPENDGNNPNGEAQSLLMERNNLRPTEWPTIKPQTTVDPIANDPETSPLQHRTPII